MNIEDLNMPITGWLDHYVWPQIQAMMCHDAYFKLMGRARELTGKFNGPIAGLIESGYVTSQTLAIRRLCDKRKDVISLRRTLVECKVNKVVSADLIDRLFGRLDYCDHVCDLVNDHIAHTANPHRRLDVTDWKLQVGQLAEAQRAVCEVAIALDRDLLGRKNYVKIIPVPQFDIMQDFKCWVPDATMKSLWDFWHSYSGSVNAWTQTKVL